MCYKTGSESDLSWLMVAMFEFVSDDAVLKTCCRFSSCWAWNRGWLVAILLRLAC
jgi:hypothetical protein